MKKGTDKKKKKMSGLMARENRQGWFAVSIALIVILIIQGYPMFKGIYESFTNWDGLFKNDFIGLKNYIRIFTKPEFWKLLSNNFILLLFLPVQLLLGLIVAMLMYEEIPGWKFYRACYYLPQVTSALSIGYLFAVMFGLDGPVNMLLSKIGIAPVYWLGKRSSGLIVIMICMVWINIGWQGMLFLGGMTQIPESVYEAARLDGAGYWKRMFKITLPMLSDTVVYSVVMSLIWCFTGLFSLIKSITNGGPGYETTTVDYMIYLRAFQGTSKFGYACALAVVLMVIVLLLSIAQFAINKRQSDWR